MAPLKTTIPIDFSITDELRAYCASKWGHPKLADAHLTDFLEVFLENKRKHEDWHRTFQNFVRNSAPGGRFHNPHYWQVKIEAAKKLEYGTRERKRPDYHPREVETPPNYKKAHDMLSSLRDLALKRV